jgi:hypothetical protein
MYLEPVDQMAAMVVAYVGIGVLLILSVASDIDPANRSLVMGCWFGIALTLDIGSRYEHSVANMRPLLVALLGSHLDTNPVLGLARQHRRWRGHHGPRLLGLVAVLCRAGAGGARLARLGRMRMARP